MYDKGKLTFSRVMIVHSHSGDCHTSRSLVESIADAFFPSASL